MSLVLAGPRRTFVLLAFCESLGGHRPMKGAPFLNGSAEAWLDEAGPSTHGRSDVRIRRRHWTLGGWLVGVTLLIIARGAPAGTR